jgi:exonuclease SbcC
MSENGEFEVVDHANAGERRFIRTLSGGETFLAALSLALALAEILGGMAKERAGRLEAIFLDEGFGTLDPETLDVVATAMEELAAGGRMVGLVTHVPELAARIPTRFEVRKGPRGSTVERVEA